MLSHIHANSLTPRSRSWPSLRDNVDLWTSFEHYFQGRVIRTVPLSSDNGPYLFAFAPHGIYPTSTFWSTRGRQFRELFPDLDIDICGATITFFAPLVREVLMWCGARDVSRASIELCLTRATQRSNGTGGKGRSLLLIPGGQREMRWSSADDDTLYVCTKHSGFIRIALKHGTPIVPMLCIGETRVLMNVYLPKIQSWTTKYLGFGFPLFPYGRALSPLPRPLPVAVIFGEPIECPKTAEPSDDTISDIHEKFYQQIEMLFDKHKCEAGYPHMQIKFTKD